MPLLGSMLQFLPPLLLPSPPPLPVLAQWPERAWAEPCQPRPLCSACFQVPAAFIHTASSSPCLSPPALFQVPSAVWASITPGRSLPPGFVLPVCTPSESPDFFPYSFRSLLKCCLLQEAFFDHLAQNRNPSVALPCHLPSLSTTCCAMCLLVCTFPRNMFICSRIQE